MVTKRKRKCPVCEDRWAQAHLDGLCNTCSNASPMGRPVGSMKHRLGQGGTLDPDREGARRVLPPVAPNRVVVYRNTEFDVIWDGT
jgi:hypothetical protein